MADPMTAYADTLIGTAFQAYQAGDHAGADTLLRLAVGAGRHDAHALYFIGHLAYLRGELDAARVLLSAALDLAPTHARAHNDLGETLRALGRPDEAVPHLERAIALEPGLAHAYGNLAAALVALDRPEDALHWARRSLAHATDQAVAQCDLASILGRLGRPHDAARAFRHALALRPDDPRIRYFDSLVRLGLGEMPDAWDGHEARLALPPGPPHDHRPRWQGEPGIAGRTILLHAEQGLGDTVQFLRYAPLVAALGALVVLEVQPGLRALAGSLPGAYAVRAQGDPLPDFDLQCPLMSLPAAFRTSLATIPADMPYLRPAPDRITRWRQRLGPRDRPRIGLAWSGSAAHAADRARSIPLARLAPLLARADIAWHVLQGAIRPEDEPALRALPQLHDHTTAPQDFGDAAALVSLMDLVISVDTAIAHLAGALARPAWVLLPYAADWRWMHDRDDSPWYPTLRLFRQPARGDWRPVLDAVARALDHWPDAALRAPAP